MATLKDINEYNKKLGLRVKSSPRRLQLRDQDFTLHRSVLMEKAFPSLNVLEKELSGMAHMKIDYYIKGNIVIIYIECPWAANHIFGSNSGLTYVMGIVITKKFLGDLLNQISLVGEMHLRSSLTMRSLFMLNYKTNIEVLSNMLFTGMYVIPKKGKSIFINTMLDLFVKNKDSDKTKDIIEEMRNEFNESLPMFKMSTLNAYITAEDINTGKFAQNIPTPDKSELSLYEHQVSLWDNGLSWDIALINKLNEYGL